MDANFYTEILRDELLKSLEYYNHCIEPPREVHELWTRVKKK